MIKSYFGDIDLIATPPLQIRELAKLQARVHMDCQLIRRVVDLGSDEFRTRVLEEYRYGIDWVLLRNVLRDGTIPRKQVYALKGLIRQAAWEEQESHAVGVWDTSECELCRCPNATTVIHHLWGCGATDSEFQQLVWNDDVSRHTLNKKHKGT